jgi:hypothetical protein
MTPDKSHVPQADPPIIGLHNSNQRRDKEKVTDHVRDKCAKTYIKLKHNSMSIFAYRVRVALFQVWCARELGPNGFRNLDKDAQKYVRIHFILTQVGRFC